MGTGWLKRLLFCALVAMALHPAPDVQAEVHSGESEAKPETLTDTMLPEPGGLTLDDVGTLLGEVPEAPQKTEEVADPQGPAPPLTWDGIISDTSAFARTFPQRLADHASGAVDDLSAGRLTRRAQIGVGLAATLSLLLVGLVMRAVRGSGDVVVLLDYPEKLRGTFSVQLLRRPEKPRNCRVKNPEDASRLGASTRHHHHMVSRETSFRDVPCRRTWFVVEGFLQSAEGGEVVSTHFATREIRPERGGTVRLEFDVSPRSCPVEVRVTWDDRPVDSALVARKGAPGSMRFARGPVHFSLNRGQHVFVAGNADRVCEVPVEVESFEPIPLQIDLADRQHLLFTGCPPAVEPYMNGDVSAAARALERDGQTETAHRLLAAFHLEHGRGDTAAKHYETAGDLREAAELHQAASRHEEAAALWERAGDDERAAESYRSAGRLVRAGEAYTRADAYDSAVECFRKAGDVSRWIEALEKKGDVYEAAVVALDQGDRARAIHCLAKGAVTDSHYPEAAMRLAEAYQGDGHGELATRKLEELIATRRADELDSERLDCASKLLEANGAHERALDLLEQLRVRDATYPNLATRIEALRKRRSRSQAVTDPSDSAGRSEFGQEFRYEILEELGRGGMGIVFRARDRRLGRVVALKRLPDNLRNHPKAVELFLREARAAAALNHPNIVTLFDAGQEGDTFYLTMELLEGMPLQRILSNRKQLAPAHVARLGGQVATGLEYAHEQGIVHRDIKTANLFFTNKRLVKIMDFGLAKMVEEVRRAATVIGGTPYYMAPEQSAGEAVDQRADIYALGVTFYELLAGSVPFREGDVAFHHRHTPPPDLREVAPDTPPELAELVAGMLAKQPDDRVATAGEVRERLQALTRQLG
jgi:tRNA A-37 threonylcarbamoyl transferase component Bud32/Tfp pilus assembly protein PilF